MAVDDCAPAAAAGALSGSEVPLAAAGVLSGSALLHSLPLDLLSTSVIAALDSPARAALRATCRQARLIVNGATRAVRLTGMDLAALMAQGPAGFDATLAAAFPRCQALTLVDTPGCSGNEGRVDSDLMERLLGLGPGGAARGLATGGFLANLTSLDVRGCSYLTARGLRLLLRATPSLHCFTATRWCETASLLDLPSLRHLHTLVLGDAAVDTLAVNDPTLETCVAACASLTSLSLQRCVAVTDAGLAALARLPRLARLCVAGTRVAGGDGGAALAAMAPRLACLDAAGCAALGDGALRALRGGSPGGQQAALREVHLGGTACTNAGLAHLTGMPSLAHVSLGPAFELTDEGLRALAACGALRRLSFGSLSLASPPPPGAWFPALERVEFGGACFNRGVRHAFPLGPRVAELVASGYDTCSDGHVACLARQRSLVRLELRAAYQLSAAGLQALAQLPALAHLTLVACPLVTPGAVEALLRAAPSLDVVVVRQSAHEPCEGGRRLRRVDVVGCSSGACGEPSTGGAAAAATAAGEQLSC